MIVYIVEIYLLQALSLQNEYEVQSRYFPRLTLEVIAPRHRSNAGHALEFNKIIIVFFKNTKK